MKEYSANVRKFSSIKCRKQIYKGFHYQDDVLARFVFIASRYSMPRIPAFVMTKFASPDGNLGDLVKEHVRYWCCSVLFKFEYDIGLFNINLDVTVWAQDSPNAGINFVRCVADESLHDCALALFGLFSLLVISSFVNFVFCGFQTGIRPTALRGRDKSLHFFVSPLIVKYFHQFILFLLSFFSV